MIEIRLKFNDPRKVLSQLLSEGSVIEEYETEDVFFSPKDQLWDYEKKNFRLRENTIAGVAKVYLIYREVEWSRNSKTFKVEWKYELPNALDQGVEIVKSWGFEEIVRYKKLGKHLKSLGGEIYYEEIEHIGPMVEIERNTQEEIDQAIAKLFKGLDYQIVAESVPSLVSKSLTLKTK
ncbi:MAG: hypothetical protein A3F33_03110 [Candidatus Woykebacteria bacterium RIFCSPHIGHO2_12_FULL_43_10]|uniref:CYTH domain-containing protein n=2 Tax=Candidatus Woykeibacteriota TaxID=1817899 RepID=A0A1G1WXP3_9BACT|nr:MAG: hypothetical protein A3J50_01310 [Candidatus Woykebacteria bacterium RIFCSPHIGHO2_02_FULL_43_16b]OGY29809.1 MAG: hypothetical protein A3F33_03110 [Candidatus Woykebacteria bacterium RIFCSPHIGHO2_12_FULL_43_10]OGY32483.1 MAG: hypothetical protein A3A61_00835 [Candidatus Woykebacteria bacterium RIFCSPLOWO2_01_FULL_43_14]